MSNTDECENDISHPLTNGEAIPSKSSKNISNDREYDGQPIDHGWAWMTVVACFGVCTLVVGSMKSFGVLLVELTRRLNAPISLIVSTQSVAGFLHLGLAPMANALSYRFSYRLVIFIGGIFTSVGLIATAFVTSVGWLFITYGIITGIGFGLTLGPSLVCMGLHFNDRRAFANGLSTAGSGAGSFALPNLIRFLLFEYGYNGCLLILGAVVLNTCTCAMLFRPFSFWTQNNKLRKNTARKAIEENSVNVDYNPSKNDFEIIHSSTGCINKKNVQDDTSEFSSHPNIKLLYGDTAVKLRNSSLELLKTQLNTLPPKINLASNSSYSYNSMESLCIVQYNIPTQNISDSVQKETFCSKCLGHLDWSLLKNPVFILINLSIWLGIFGHNIVFNCLPSLCEEFGMSDTDGALIVSVVGLADLFGRITAGWIADFKILQRKTVFQTSLALFSVCMFVIPHINEMTGMCVISVLTGISTGGYIGTQISVLADTFGIEKLSSSLGFVYFFASISLLTSPFISGITKDVSGSWTNAIRLGASSAVLGALLLFLFPLANRISSKGEYKGKKVKMNTSPIGAVRN